MSTAPAKVWYFAYGSNMQTATLRGRRGVVFDRAMAARVRGWRVVFDKPPLLPIGESFANLVADPQATALGVLYEISDADLQHIDLTEGVLIGNYRRIAVSAVPLAAVETPRPAFTLVSDQRDPTLHPSRRYMDLLIAGCGEHGLPADYAEFLHTVPTAPETPEALAFRALVDATLRRES